MKITEHKQVITLEGFTDQSWKVVRNNAYSVYLIGLSITSVFVLSDIIGIRWALSIPCLMSGIVGILGSDYVTSQISVWVDQMMIVKSQEEMEEKSPEHSPVNESTPIVINSTSDGDGTPYEVEITWLQLREIVECAIVSTHLTRSSLTTNAFPKLSREWRDGNIQRKCRKLGLTDINNNFILDNSGVGGYSSPEADTYTDTGQGVGGSE